MVKTQMIGDVSSSVLGMLSDLIVKLKKQAITPRELELFLNRKNPFVTVDDVRAEWQEFYSRVLGMEIDLAEVKIPDEKSGFDRVIFIPNGLTMGRAIAACRKRFKVCTFADDLDRGVPTNDRSPENGPYAILIRDRREADEELKNLSAKDLASRGINGITLLERLVLELKYHDETGEHLDVKNATLCRGSLSSYGRVPQVHWHENELHVDWLYPNDADDDLRARAVVSV